MDVTPYEVELHIGELILRGLAPDQATAVAEGLHTELGRLLTGGSVPAGGGHEVVTVAISAGAPADLATGVAQAVYRQLGA